VIVVDASVWISGISYDELNCAVASAWFADRIRRRDEIVVPSLFLAEVTGVMTRRSGDEAFGLALMQEILDNSLNTDLAVRSAKIAARTRLRGADAVCIAVAKLHNAPLFTWDRKQLERGAAVADVRQPAIDR
jgi:predicted nucleic acid-binding protein